MKSSDAKASKCRLKFSSKMSIFIRLLYSKVYQRVQKTKRRNSAAFRVTATRWRFVSATAILG